MNRLVIIGNGFDLAHGLPTRYKDFIDDYWESIKDTNHNELVTFNLGCYGQFNGHKNLNNLIDLIANINSDFRREGIEIYKFKEHLQPLTDNRIQILQYKNKLFKLINEIPIENWVDVENEYYKELKKILKSSSLSIEYKKRYVKNLNIEFEQIKNLFEIYLQERVVDKYELNFTKNQNVDWIKIYNYLKPISLMSNEHNIFKEFIKAEDVNEIKKHFKKEGNEEIVNNLYFLNFNYTPIASIYSAIFEKEDRIESVVNFIHGELQNVSNNKINFGFGDEMDDDYKLIENIDDNEYLKNFKSFQYLQNSNYNDLLRYIDSEKFQVLIMGHSCGLSDRTLLNTIFEHNNCRSIKVFYHERKDENGKVINDNYTEIIQNISRHFNKKKLMREKIVNKTLCQPLPQIKLPLK
ncbi:AbiH family protein [Flavobacterium praedii]|uniref:AbiH family protein n=1 Tax=Flavobacterium praedii TaxID=3002900 RepID=UPI002481F5DD|nr:AbiH family protein [Flavobacterium praedii]